MPKSRADRSAGVIALVDLVGRALGLQLVFLVCALPVVTALPALIALQRRLDALVHGEGGGVTALVVETLRLWRSTWLLGLGLVVLVLGAFAAFPFWYAMPSPLDLVGTGGLALLAGLVLGVLVGILDAARRASERGSLAWLRAGWGAVLTRPLRVAWAVVMVITWAMLAAALPTLLLVGAGLAPVLLVRLALPSPLAGPAAGEGQAIRS